MITPSYKCSQQNLYDVARAGWTSCNAHLAAFTAFKPKYVALFVTARVDEINAAEALPDEEQRLEDSKTLRLDMETTAKQCRKLWQQLKRYIVEAYPDEEMAEIKLIAAGQAHYRKASNDEWAAVKSLMKDGNDFITNNTATLSANDNMPAGFPLTFATAKDDFDTLYASFITAGQNDEVETQSKVEANNDVHEKLMSMFLDGQEIFSDDEAVKKLFTFDQVLLNVSGPGNQGYKGNITRSDAVEVTEGTVQFQGPTNKTVNIDEEGHYDCLQLATGTGYKVTITVPGCQLYVQENLEVETGTMHTLNAEMTPIP